MLADPDLNGDRIHCERPRWPLLFTDLTLKSMPTARFQSPRAQRTAVGVLTMTVFLLALLLAWFYTSAHQTPWDVSMQVGEVAGLKAPLPENWIRTDVHDPQPGFASAVTVLEDPVLVGRKLIIGQVEVHTPLSPESVLRSALTQIVRAQPRIYQDREPVQRLRLGRFCAAWYHAESQSQPQSPIFSDRIVVFTRDGRRHWLAALSMPQHFADRAQDANERILRSLVAGAAELGELTPSPADFADAMLPPVSVPGATVLTDTSDPMRPIVVVPDAAAGGNHVGIVRVVGTLDPSVDDKNPLHPLTHLTRQAAEVIGGKPDVKAIDKDAGGGWSVRLTSPARGDEIERLWQLVPIAPGRAAMLEILAEGPALEATSALATQVALALRAEPPSAASAAPPSIDDALTRGTAVVQGQRDLLAKLTQPAWRFFTLQRGHQPIGVQIEYVQRRDEMRLPVRGKRIRQIALAAEEVAWADWWASLDGLRLDSAIYHELRQGLQEQNVSYRMVLRDDRLTIRANPAAGSPILWADEVTDQYLPAFLEETWNMQSIHHETIEAPALVWRSRGLLHPTPWWARTYKLDATSARAGVGAAPPKAAALLTLRPMYGMDAERFWLDGEGRILAAQWQETARLPSGGVTLTRTATDEASVVRRYPRARDIIRLWQQDASHDEE